MADLPSPPFIVVPGVHNFRDIGGYGVRSPPDSLGGSPVSVKRGLIYRCAELTNIAGEGKSKLGDLGIKTIFDLRSFKEAEKSGGKSATDTAVPGISRVPVPVFEDQDFSPEQLALRYRPYLDGGTEGFTQAYSDILENGAPSFTRIFKHLRDTPNDPFIVHCAAGKDRTGVFAALVLNLAGVDDETIAQEYSLTEMGLKEWMPWALAYVEKSLPFRAEDESVKQMLSAR
jgi:protein tyrosine/serine phosphatase